VKNTSPLPKEKRIARTPNSAGYEKPGRPEKGRTVVYPRSFSYGELKPPVCSRMSIRESATAAAIARSGHALRRATARPPTTSANTGRIAGVLTTATTAADHPSRRVGLRSPATTARSPVANRIAVVVSPKSVLKVAGNIDPKTRRRRKARISVLGTLSRRSNQNTTRPRPKITSLVRNANAASAPTTRPSTSRGIVSTGVTSEYFSSGQSPARSDLVASYRVKPSLPVSRSTARRTATPAPISAQSSQDREGRRTNRHRLTARVIAGS
jgi:hypothetical protein